MAKIPHAPLLCGFFEVRECERNIRIFEMEKLREIWDDNLFD